MGILGKLKNLFYEEDVIESVPVPQSKIKEVFAEEIKPEKKVDQQELKRELKKDVDGIVSERELFKTEPTFKFPVIFEDDDFSAEKKEKKGMNVLEAENNKYKITEISKVTKEEKKSFKPSLVISPIYGVLDKNYKKDDITNKDNSVSNIYEAENKIDIDAVRKKAYGELNTREEKFYNNIESSTKAKSEPVINLFADAKAETEEEKDYEEVAYDLDEIDKKIKSIDDLLKETTDDDFYSLVDSMYKDEGEE